MRRVRRNRNDERSKPTWKIVQSWGERYLGVLFFLVVLFVFSELGILIGAIELPADSSIWRRMLGLIYFELFMMGIAGAMMAVHLVGRAIAGYFRRSS